MNSVTTYDLFNEHSRIITFFRNNYLAEMAELYY